MDGFHKPESRAIVLRENLVRYKATQYIKENHVENERKTLAHKTLVGGGGDV
jgi:hypothetical protein